MSCLVAGCRYSTTHVTSAHRCGTCAYYGHGVQDCGKPHRIHKLRERASRLSGAVAMPCTVANCDFRWTHTTEAHHCKACGGRSDLCSCPPCPPPIDVVNVDEVDEVTICVQCPICRTKNHADLASGVFTGNECVACMQSKKLLVFPTCRHAVMCGECAQKWAPDADFEIR